MGAGGGAGASFALLVCGNLFLLRLGQDEAAARGVEVEELGVAAPVDGGLNLPLAFVGAELLVEHVEEELFGDSVVGFGFEGAANLTQEQDVFGGCCAEELFL